jgi:methyltransferase-like protein/SAM-dependent methyltransferase
MTDAPTTYDEIPYTSHAYPLTHPDRLAMVGRLFGMEPPDVTRARVLELGCASGGNLIPMAEQYPGGTFVGVDLSARQIEEGQGALADIGIDNVTLRKADIERIDAGWGTFDYILCHGVYSWVPPSTQERILEICNRNLSPEGIAYISYNTYPGWHVRESVRHMTRFHVAQFTDAHEQTEQAAALVDFLASSVAEDDLYGRLLRRELDILARTSPEYLFHEHLEHHNAPLYFHQFAERLGPKGLQYLGEADVHTMLAREMDPAVAETLGRISPDIIVLEQYMDFVRNRQFRQSLICHEDVELDRNIRPEILPGFFIGYGGTVRNGAVDLRSDVMQTFESDGEISVSSGLPIAKAALTVAGERWPDAVGFEELCEAAGQRLEAAGVSAPEPDVARQQLAVDLLACFLQGLLELRTSAPPVHRGVPERPKVSAYARWQLARGTSATNRRHVRVAFDDAAARIVGMLDGSRDREGLIDGLVELLAAGKLELSSDDGSTIEPSTARETLGNLVDQTLSFLGDYAMMVD